MSKENLHDFVVCVGTTYPEAISQLLSMVDTQKLLNTLRSKTIWEDPWSAFFLLNGFGEYPNLRILAAQEVLKRARELGYTQAQREAAFHALPRPLLYAEKMYAGGLAG